MNAPVTSFQPDAENTRLLRDAFGRFATGVTVVTAMSDDGPVGITANSFTSVSLDPAMVLWSPSKTSRRFPYFEAVEHYAIHILAAEQESLCWSFAKDAFAMKDMDFVLNAEGVPMFENALARFECKQASKFDAGDHMIILGNVLRADMRDGDGMAFFGGKNGKIISA